MRILAWVAALLVIVPTNLFAQSSVGLAPHIGTLGLGVDVAVSLSDMVSVRGGANFQPYSPEADISDLAYTLELPSPSFMATLDVHPGGRSFRFSGGFVYFGGDLALEAAVNESVEIGDTEYTPAEVGTLLGTLVTNEFAPYLGIGLGNVAHATTGFFMDVGVAFHGTPDIDLSATGPVSTDPDFQADLNQEASEIRDEIDGITVYPVLSFGVKFAVR